MNKTSEGMIQRFREKFCYSESAWGWINTSPLTPFKEGEDT